jgi:hypothetical protein
MRVEHVTVMTQRDSLARYWPLPLPRRAAQQFASLRPRLCPLPSEVEAHTARRSAVLWGHHDRPTLGRGPALGDGGNGPRLVPERRASKFAVEPEATENTS